MRSKPQAHERIVSNISQRTTGRQSTTYNSNRYNQESPLKENNWRLDNMGSTDTFVTCRNADSVHQGLEVTKLLGNFGVIASKNIWSTVEK